MVNFRQATSLPDTFKVVSNLSGKNNTISLPDSLVVGDMSVSDPADILSRCASHFFPLVPPSSPTQALLEASTTS